MITTQACSLCPGEEPEETDGPDGPDGLEATDGPDETDAPVNMQLKYILRLPKLLNT